MQDQAKPLQRVQQGNANLDKMTNEKNSLKQKLASETQTTKAMSKTLAKKTEMNRLYEQQHVYLKKIEIERAKIEMIDECIEKTHRKILEQRKKVGANDPLKQNAGMIMVRVYILPLSHFSFTLPITSCPNMTMHLPPAAKKQIRILENRLNQALVKFNEQVAQNKELRKEIDDMRQERVVFDGIYKKLERYCQIEQSSWQYKFFVQPVSRYELIVLQLFLRVDSEL